MTPEEITEDSPEVQRAAEALASYYDGGDEAAEDWVGGAVVALGAVLNTTQREWGIVNTSTPTRLHRGPMTEAEAIQWKGEWARDGGRSGAFAIVFREVGDWLRAGKRDGGS